MCPCTILPLFFFFFFRSTPLREVIKIYYPPLKRGRRGGFKLWKPCILSEIKKCGSKFIEDNGALEIYKFIKTSWFYKYQIYKYLMKHRHLPFLRQSLIYFREKNMVCFVQTPQQSYLKLFQNNMFILFCTRIYMEMNNLRVGELKH